MGSAVSIDDLLQSAISDWNKFFAKSVNSEDNKSFLKGLEKIGNKRREGNYASSLAEVERQYASFNAIGEKYQAVKRSVYYVDYGGKLAKLYTLVAQELIREKFAGKAETITDYSQIQDEDRLLVICGGHNSILLLGKTYALAPWEKEFRASPERYARGGLEIKKVKLNNDGNIQVVGVVENGPLNRFELMANDVKDGLVYRLKPESK